MTTWTAHFYDAYFTSLNAKKINLTSDTIKCALVSTSYTPNQGTDQFWSTPQANEVSGTGYTAGGITLSSISVSISGGVWSFTSTTNPSWTGATLSNIGFAVVYDSTPGTAATDPLIGYINFGGAQAVSGGTFTVTWNGSGIGTVTPA